jgi:hypothetical protein
MNSYQRAQYSITQFPGSEHVISYTLEPAAKAVAR